MFRIANAVGGEEEQKELQSKKKIGTSSEEGGMDWSVVSDDDEPAKSAESTHAEISSDNKTLRSSTSVSEKVFDIKLEETICGMRNDTRLVLIDVPGINEADSCRKFKDYVKSYWTTFDCVIVVMDAVQGVNTEEQVELLKFVKQNNEEGKDIPTIILGNKMDDPDHEQKLELVRETRQKTIEIFGESCSKDFLRRVLLEADDTRGVHGVGLRASGAVFIPISAAYAFVYRKAGSLTVESLQKLDKDILDDIGQMEVGIKKWRKLSNSKKCQVVRDVISDPSEYYESLSRTNFHNFLSVLAYYVGGDTAQRSLLSKQIDVVLQYLAPDGSTGCLANALHYVYKRCQSVGRSTDDLSDNFWRVFSIMSEKAFKKIKADVDPSALAPLFVELQEYYKLAERLGWDFEKEQATKEAKKLLSEQLTFVVNESKDWSFEKFAKSYGKGKTTFFCGGANYDSCARNYGINGHNGCIQNFYRKDKVTGVEILHQCGKETEGDNLDRKKSSNLWIGWNNLSPHDWIIILSSVLLPSNEIEFYKYFGNEKTGLESSSFQLRTRYELGVHFLIDGNTSLTTIETSYINEVRTKPEKNDNDAFLKLVMPSDLTNPSHWGHIGWKYVEFCRSIGN